MLLGRPDLPVLRPRRPAKMVERLHELLGAVVEGDAGRSQAGEEVLQRGQRRFWNAPESSGEGGHHVRGEVRRRESVEERVKPCK